MRTITLRNISPELVRILRRRAQAEGKSLCKTVIQMLEESAGLRKQERPALHHDLDFLAGSWTKEEAAAFETALKDVRKIDRELWQ